MADTPKSVTITNGEIWIDGAKFPWYLANEGPTIEVREDYDDLRMLVLHLPVIVVEEREKALAGRLLPQLSGAPIRDLRTRSKVELSYDLGDELDFLLVRPGKERSATRRFEMHEWDKAMDYARRHAR